jgi:hypothetical protein
MINNNTYILVCTLYLINTVYKGRERDLVTSIEGVEKKRWEREREREREIGREGERGSGREKKKQKEGPQWKIFY